MNWSLINKKLSNNHKILCYNNKENTTKLDNVIYKFLVNN